MEPIKEPSLLAWVHPAIGTAGLVLAFVLLRQGLAQRRQRLVGTPAPPGTLKRHSRLGPWAVAVLLGASLGGPASSVLFRGWQPFASAHGKLGMLCAASFAVMWWLGRRLLRGEKKWAGLHGVLGLVTMLTGAVVALLGISMLP